MNPNQSVLSSASAGNCAAKSRAAGASVAPVSSQSLFSNSLMKGQVALVTGGGSGIGKAIAEAFAAHGCSVFIIGRKIEKLQQAKQDIEAKIAGGRVDFCSCDVRNYDYLVSAFQKCVESFGSLDVLVCSAAGNFLCPAAQLSSNAFKTVMEIDALGTFLSCKAAYEVHMRSSGGVILAISATLQYTGNPLQVHAGSAKAAIDAMAKHLSVEWGADGVRVNCLAPGPIDDTEGFSRLCPKPLKDEMLQSIPLKRWGTLQDMQNAALFLCSQASSNVTGAVMVSDGGAWLTNGAAQLVSKL